MNQEELWGITFSIDLYECDPLYINSCSEIKRYAIEICDLIKMKRYGKPIIEWFGREEKVKGFSLVQLIETSSITGHFCSNRNSAHIDIFSCKMFDTVEALKFSVDFFNAKETISSILHRK